MSPSMVLAGCPAANSVGSVGANRTDCARGTNHDSTKKVLPGTFAESPAVSWCVDGYCFQRLVPASASS